MKPTVVPFETLTLGATVTDVDLSQLDDDTWTHIEKAFIEHAALVFPGQFLSRDDQVRFAERFGDIEILRENEKAVPIRKTCQPM
mgnify:FL=1